jgi:hypothetical protein
VIKIDPFCSSFGCKGGEFVAALVKIAALGYILVGFGVAMRCDCPKVLQLSCSSGDLELETCPEHIASLFVMHSKFRQHI